MFISFFTGKVMLFYGISLIMKEKSNASALSFPILVGVSRPRFGRLTSQIRSSLVPRSLTSIGFVFSPVIVFLKP